MMAPMLQKRGDAWVGVTERTSAGEALKQTDPTRYADVNLPTNDLAWDMLAQVGAAIRKGGSQSPLRASIPSTSTWPGTRRAASTPRGSRWGSPSTTARRRASRCTTGTSRPLTPPASRRSRRGPRCSPRSSTRCGPPWAYPSSTSRTNPASRASPPSCPNPPRPHSGRRTTPACPPRPCGAPTRIDPVTSTGSTRSRACRTRRAVPAAARARPRRFRSPRCPGRVRAPRPPHRHCFVVPSEKSNSAMGTSIGPLVC